MIARRGFLAGILAAAVAPAIVRPAHLMRLRRPFATSAGGILVPFADGDVISFAVDMGAGTMTYARINDDAWMVIPA